MIIREHHYPKIKIDPEHHYLLQVFFMTMKGVLNRKNYKQHVYKNKIQIHSGQHDFHGIPHNNKYNK